MDPQILVLIILGVTVVLLVTEWIPIAVTGILLPVALVAFGILGAGDAFAVLAHPLTLMVTCAFVYGAAFFRVGLADVVGNFVQRMADRYAKGSEAFVLGLVMAVTALMSSILPNVGVVAALLPVFLAIAKSTGIANGRLLMPVAFASSIGGLLTLIGSPNNLIGRGALETAGAGTLGFLEFAWMGIPFTILGILYVVTVGRRWLPSAPVLEQASVAARVPVAVGAANAGGAATPVSSSAASPTGAPGGAESAPSTPAVPLWHRALTLAMFGLFVLSITLENITGVDAYLIGFVGIAVLVGSRVLPENEAYKSISWSTLFFIVGILTLAGAIVSTGASDLVANALVQLLGGTPNPYILTGGMFLISATLTQFMSNTATAGILAPIAISMAVGIGGDPRALVMAVILGASSAFITAIGTPANMMIAGPGNIKFTDWVRCGWPLLMVGLVIALVVLPFVWPFYP